ncbi:MAG: SIMPL domain-containing protein [bacterium]
MQGVTFGLRSASRARQDALAMAVREAREKADAIAGAAGLRIRAIERIVEAGDGVILREQRLAPSVAAQTPI